MANAVTKYVEKDDKDAVKDFVEDHLERQVKLIVDRKTAVEAVEAAIETSKGELGDDARHHRSSLAKRNIARDRSKDVDFDFDDEVPTAPSTKISASNASKNRDFSDSDGNIGGKKKAKPARAAPTRNTAKNIGPAPIRTSKKSYAISSSSQESDDGFEKMPAAKKRKL